jgi:hypothetical protein
VHVEAELYWQEEPVYPLAQMPQLALANPVSQTHVPLPCAVPWPEQVTPLLYWQVAPTKPALHEQVPLVWAVPLPLQVMVLLYWHKAPA